jgi:general secretion pathway protein G
MLRLLAVVVVGSVVAGTAYLCAYFSMRNSPYYRYQAWKTRHELDRLTEDIETHRQKTGHPPSSLTELDEAKDRCRTDDAGRIVDGWRHPFQYRAEDDTFTLLSYGRDGQPGGEGDDADLEPGRRIEPPTIRQFTFEMSTGGIQASCILAGVCAGLVCLLPSRSRGGYARQVAVSSAGALFVAFILSLIHSSGH